MALVLIFSLTFANLAHGRGEGTETYIRSKDHGWIIRANDLEASLSLREGKLLLTSFSDFRTHREYADPSGSDEVRFDINSKPVSRYGAWLRVHYEIHKLPQGETQLDLKLRNESVGITKHYVVYPGCSLIREWMNIRNISGHSLQLSNPEFLSLDSLGKTLKGWQVLYITGGGPYNGSQLLKAEIIGDRYRHEFDSHANGETASYTAYTNYLPLIALQHPASSEGVSLGWDYMGHWKVRVGDFGEESFQMSVAVAGFRKVLQSDEEIETPRAFLALFHGDIDDMGNSLLDWQYGYMWDLTNADYFAKTRWAVDWPPPWVGSGGFPSGDNWGYRLALDLRYIDLMREAGGDILWDDAGWYDRWGDWNAPEWKLTNDYVRKYDMRWLLWWPTFMAHPLSSVAQAHPDWMVPNQPALNQSLPPTLTYQEKLLDRGAKEWGDFQWRFDAPAAISRNDTDALAADQNLRSLITSFRQTHPASGVDACFAGGRWISYDMARLADSGEYTDGGVGPYTAYYTSLLIPPDKLHNVVDLDHTFYNAASDRTHISLDPVWYRDPGDGPDVEAIRKDWQIYHYLEAQGIVGRWSHVFRPRVENDDPVWYFQRMDRTQSKGVIIARHSKMGPQYYVTAELIRKPEKRTDIYFGSTAVNTTSVARLDAGVYKDPVDARPRFYGVSGETFGPVNFKYETQGGDESFLTGIAKLGGTRRSSGEFFGMAIQPLGLPVTITELGLFAGDFTAFEHGMNQGTYRLRIVRGEDGAILASADLDMRHGNPDFLGFKYVRLAPPVRLDADPQVIVIHPHGLNVKQTYSTNCAESDCRSERKGDELMRDGIRFSSVLPGELIYLNLRMHPGSGLDKTPPQPPATCIKRVGSNLGVQGVELKWDQGTDNNWISYYEVLRDGVVLGKVAKGTFFFDHSGFAQNLIGANYEVRTVDGDGNQSPLVAARVVSGEPETYRSLGGFGAAQGEHQWRYEESLDGTSFQPMRWTTRGYEGRWEGSRLAQIGRIWMQPGVTSDVARVFVSPANATLFISGTVRKDPQSRDDVAIQVRVLLNNTQIWPTTGWQDVPPNYPAGVSFRLQSLAAGHADFVRFVVRHTGKETPDPVIWDPEIIVERTR